MLSTISPVSSATPRKLLSIFSSDCGTVLVFFSPLHPKEKLEEEPFLYQVSCGYTKTQSTTSSICKMCSSYSHALTAPIRCTHFWFRMRRESQQSNQYSSFHIMLRSLYERLKWHHHFKYSMKRVLHRVFLQFLQLNMNGNITERKVSYYAL